MTGMARDNSRSDEHAYTIVSPVGCNSLAPSAGWKNSLTWSPITARALSLTVEAAQARRRRMSNSSRAAMQITISNKNVQ